MDRTINLSITIGRRTGRLIVAGLMVVALAVPGTALAIHVFNDVPTGHTFHAAIANIYNRGLTTGCGGGSYCPEDNVTRGQMAAFLDRMFKAEGNTLGYAAVNANGSIAGGYARNLGAVTALPEASTGYYRISFGGLTITDHNVIIVQPRQTFGNEVCRVYQGASGTTAEVFCHTIADGSPAIDIAFNVVVYN